MGTLGRLAAGAQHQHRVAVQHHLVGQVGHLADDPDVADHRWHRGHRALHVDGERRQPARVDGADDDVGGQLALVGAYAAHPAARDHEVERLRAGQHGHPPGLQPGGQRLRERPHPARHGPGPEVLLDVGPHPHPRRHVAQVVALQGRAEPGHLAQAVVLERLLQHLVHRQAGREQGLGVLAGVLGRPGALQPVAAQRLPVVGEGVDVRRPLGAEPGPEALHRGHLVTAAAAGEVQHGLVLEDVAAQGLHRHQLDLALQRPPGLAEQVAHHRGEQRVGRSGVPAEAVLLDVADGSAEVLRALQDGHLVADLGQSRGARQPAVPAADHHHSRHGGHPRGWLLTRALRRVPPGRRPGSGSGVTPRRSPVPP